VQPVGVGGLNDQGVDRAARRFRVANDGQSLAADVAGEHQPVTALFGDPHVDAGGTQDVARVEILEAQILAEVVHPPVGNRLHQVLHRDRVYQAVERLAFFARPAVPGQQLEILFLDIRRIGQHDRAEIAGGGGRKDGAMVTAVHQQGEPADVIDVGMAHHHEVDAAGIESEILVQVVDFLAVALEETGVEENPGAGGLQHVHAAGDLAGGAMETELQRHFNSFLVVIFSKRAGAFLQGLVARRFTAESRATARTPKTRHKSVSPTSRLLCVLGGKGVSKLECTGWGRTYTAGNHPVPNSLSPASPNPGRMNPCSFNSRSRAAA
jgi:hypothetical protein